MNVPGDPMNEKYLQDEDVVQFKISSKFGINNEIMLPLSLVENLKEHIHAFDGVVKYPFNNVILLAFATYMDYLNCELIPFDSIKPFLDDLNVEDEVVVEQCLE